METVTRNVRDLDHSERSVMEQFVGHQLQESQQITVNVVNIGLNTPGPTSDDTRPAIPDHWKIDDGLSEAEVDELDRDIRQRANLTRHVAADSSTDDAQPIQPCRTGAISTKTSRTRKSTPFISQSRDAL